MARVVDNTDRNQFDSDSTLFIDVETTTHNKGNPFDPRNKLVSYAYAIGKGPVQFKYYRDPDFVGTLRELLLSTTKLVNFAIKFDCHWFLNHGDVRFKQVIWDCQLAEFVLSGQTTRMQSLNEALESYGIALKKDAVAEYWAQGVQTDDIPYDVLKEYNIWDVEQTRKLYYNQLAIASDKQRRLIELLGEDLKTIIAAERAGIRFDEAKSNEVLDKCRLAIMEVESHLARYLPDLDPRVEFNWDSGDQLSAFLYGGTIVYPVYTEESASYKTGEKKGQEYIKRSWSDLQVTFNKLFNPIEGSEVKKTKDDPAATTRFYQVDEPTLKQLKADNKVKQSILGALATRAKNGKVVEMVESLRDKIRSMNWSESFIHPNYNQNVVVTGRLSSSGPNMQNAPVEVDELLITRY